MSILKYISVFILFATCSVASNAQVFDVDNSVDAKYTPPEGSIFDTKIKSKSSRGGSSDFKNAILINVSPLARGAVALEYGRVLTNSLVVNGALGVTIYQDYLKQITFAVYGEDPFVTEDIFADGLGLFWKAETQVYFNGAYDSEFVTFGVRNFRYNLIYKPGQGNFSSSSSESDFSRLNTSFKESNLDFFIGYGSSYVLSANLIAEFYWAAGMRRTKSSSFNVSQIDVSSSTFNISSGSEYATQLKQTEYTAILPSIIMSVKLGFGFGN